MKKMKRALAALLSLIMILGGIYWVDMEGSEVQAANSQAELLETKVQVATEEDIIRFVSTVDCLDYKEVGFEVTPEEGKTKTYTTTTVYERIASTTEGVEYTFSPKVVDTDSEYFFTAKLRATEGVDYTVRAYAVTLEDETIYGMTRCVALEDGRTTSTLNLSFDAETVPAVGNTIDVTYKATADAENNTETTAEVITVSGTAVTVRVVVDASTLPSATKFDFGTYGSAIYRNLYTKYTGENTDDQTWYDVYLAEDSEKTEFTIATNADLYGFMNMYADGNLFAGKTLYVIRDIAMNDNVTDEVVETWANGTAAPYKWTPSGNDSSRTRFQGTFDGQMHTLSGFYVNEAKTYAGMFGSTDLGSEIKNFYLTDSYMYTSGGPLDNSGVMYSYLGSVAGENRGVISNIYSDAIVASDGQRVGGIIGVHNTTAAVAEAGKQAVVDNCWFDGEVRLLDETGICGGGIVGLVQQRESTMKNLLFTGKISYATTAQANVGGIMGSENNTCTINMEDCVSVGEIVGADVAGVGSVVGLVKNAASVYSMVNVYAKNDISALAGAGTVDYPGMSVAESTLYGTDGYKNTLLDYEDTWAARTGATPVLKVFDEKYNAQAVVTDFTDVEQNNWYNASVKRYGIHSFSAFKAFSTYSQSNGFSGMTVYLNTDIDMNPGWTAPETATDAVTVPEYEWTPIGFSTKFKGIFDGRQHEIRGMYIDDTQIYLGLFGNVDSASAVIKNFSLVNSYVKYTGGSVFIGGVVGYIYGTISQVYSDAIIISDGAEFGGLAGRAEGTISECWFDGEVYSTKTTAAYMKQGGIAGTAWSQTGSGKACRPLTITNCLNTGTITHNVTTPNSTVAGVGGILGGDRGYTELTMSNCVNAGKIVSNQTAGVGSVVGCMNKNTSGVGYSNGSISNCYGETVVGTVNASCAVTLTDNVTIAPSDLKGEQVYSNTNIALDYSVWIARKNDTVIPSVFAGWIVPESEVVAQ